MTLADAAELMTLSHYNTDSLSAARYRITFIAREMLDLPHYLGSTLRGAFGHAFRTIACPAIQGECPIPNQCPYHLIFETSPPPDSDSLRTHEEIPRPFVIAPELTTKSGAGQPSRQQFHAGDEVSFELVLIGRAQEFFPYFVVALREVDHIGRGRRKVELERIEALPPVTSATHVDYTETNLITLPDQGETRMGADCILPPDQAKVSNLIPPPYQRDVARLFPPPDQGEVRRGSPDSAELTSRLPRIVYNAADNLVRGTSEPITLDDCAKLPMPEGRLTLEFLTQTRLKHEGRFIRRPQFQVVFRRLLGRLSSLARFHCGISLELNFRDLIEQAGKVHLVQDNTKWTRWQRYSSRQDRRMEWEGIIGRATYEGSLAPFWQFLKFGELVHVGHGATFGLGKYRILEEGSTDDDYKSEH